MKIRKLTALLLTLCMIFSLSVAAFAAEPEAHTIYDSAPDEEATVSAETSTSGTIPGSKIKWELNEHNWLTISGSGDCEPFTSKEDQPWAAVRDQITQVWFDDMENLQISDLAYWFEDCVNLTTAEIPGTTPVIGRHAFYNCPKLSTLTIYYGEDILESIGEDAFWRETDSGDTLYIGYLIGYPKSSVPFHDYDWSSSNRNERYFYDLYGSNSGGTMSASDVSLTSTGSITGRRSTTPESSGKHRSTAQHRPMPTPCSFCCGTSTIGSPRISNQSIRAPAGSGRPEIRPLSLYRAAPDASACMVLKNMTMRTFRSTATGISLVIS